MAIRDFPPPKSSQKPPKSSSEPQRAPRYFPPPKIQLPVPPNVPYAYSNQCFVAPPQDWPCRGGGRRRAGETYDVRTDAGY
eukprot:scaffold3980_cov163-Isochrysis_galbana.AAC.2